MGNKENACHIDLYQVADEWGWQIRHGEYATTPRHGRTFSTALAAKRAAARAADNMRLPIATISNLEEVTP